MRLISFLFVVCILGILPIKAQILSVAGYVNVPDEVEIQQLKIVLTNGEPAESIDVIRPSDNYRMDIFKNFDPDSYWFVKCDKVKHDSKEYVCGTENPLNFTPKEINLPDGSKTEMYVARVPIMEIYAIQDPSETTEIAEKKIGGLQTGYSLDVKSGRMTADEANEALSKDTAIILAGTPLGDNPDDAISKIGKNVRLKSTKYFTPLPVIRNEENFIRLRDRPEFKNRLPANRNNNGTVRSPMRSPREDDNPQNNEIDPQIFQLLNKNKQSGFIRKNSLEGTFIRVDPTVSYNVCLLDGGSQMCRKVKGRNWEEIRKVGLKQICGEDSKCIEKGMNDQRSLKIHVKGKPIITTISSP